MGKLMLLFSLPAVLVLLQVRRHRPPRPLSQGRLEEHRRRVRVYVGQPEVIGIGFILSLN